MSETAVAEVVVPEFQSDGLTDELIKRLLSPVEQAKRARVALKSDPHAALVELFENSTDENIVKIREAIEQLRQKADDLLRPQLDTNQMSKDDATALLNESAKTVKSLVDAGETIRPGFAAYAESQIEGLDSVAKRRVSNTSNGTVVRPRVKVNIDGTEHDTFSKAAKAIGGKVNDMHTAWTTAAGGKSAKDIDEAVEFEFVVADKTHKVRVMKK